MFIKLQKRFAKARLPLDVRELAEALWLTQFDLGSAVVEPEEERHEADQNSESLAPKLSPPVAPPIESGQTAQAESARLSAVGAGSEGAPAVEVRLPGATPLPQSLALGRALRPLARRRASTHRLELDEEATAIRAAESAVNKQLIVSPVFRTAPERWFSVAIVVEEGAAMSVWQPTADELMQLFIQHGGFNEVALWRLRFPASKPGEKGNPPVLVSSATGQAQPVGSLLRLGQRQLVVLLTDGVSTRWRDGRMADVLTRWGRTGTVVIAQVFGERMWQHTALGEPQFVVTSEAPGNPNKALLAQPRLPKDHLAFPVVSLSPELIGEWARMVMQPGEPYSAVALKVRTESSIGGTGSAGENNRGLPNSIQETGSEPVPPVFSISAEEHLAEFRRLVSDEAYQLAIYLSWLPLALPVMRLVQAAMFAEAKPETLAEFLLGGIARRKDGDQPIAHPNKQQFVFHDGIREALQTRIRRDELPPILRLIGDYISRRTGRRFSFTALLPHPEGDKLLPLDDELQQFADILREGLIRIGLGHLFESKTPKSEPPAEELEPPLKWKHSPSRQSG
ncbi:MAG: SAV_2336 N-terminal domain-related protein [Acidobacteriota bacterium]|nr:SAV_2336 N-terminal domain-related protein [Acidobacteriota bacterium]